MSYAVTIIHPHRGSDYATADTKAEAQKIAKSERLRNPRVMCQIEKLETTR